MYQLNQKIFFNTQNKIRLFSTSIACLFLFCLSTPIWCSNIQDVTKSDPAFLAIQSAVKKGYLPLFKDQKFLPNQTVSRKEFALILEKILVQEKEFLSEADRKDLMRLSKQFKIYLSQNDSQNKTLSTHIKEIRSEQKNIHYDMSAITEENTQLRKEVSSQKSLIWISLGLGLLGILI